VRESEKKGRKKILKRLGTALIVVVVLLPVFFLPYTPTNAVRLCILENGHPISAVFAFPIRTSHKEYSMYSGKRVLVYYNILVPFETSQGGMVASTLGVHRLKNGDRFYKAFPAADIAT